MQLLKGITIAIGPLGSSRHLWLAAQRRQFILISSDPIITQTAAKLRLPRIARRYQLWEQDVRLYESAIRAAATVVPVFPEDVRRVTGDPEDDAVLATARLGQADYLVTGDQELLMLGSYEGVRIVRPRDFLTVLGQ